MGGGSGDRDTDGLAEGVMEDVALGETIAPWLGDTDTEEVMLGDDVEERDRDMLEVGETEPVRLRV